MSIEKQARKALRRVVFWRIVGGVVRLPHALLRALASLLNAVGDLFGEVQDAVMYFELDAARRYQLLTGTDLALASGDESRYELLDPERAEAVREGIVEEDEDE